MSSEQVGVINRRFRTLMTGTFLAFLLAGIGMAWVWYDRIAARAVATRRNLVSAPAESVHPVSSKPPVLNATGELYRAFLADGGFSQRLWIQALLVEPVRPDRKLPTFWQFTNRTRVAGVTTYLNLHLIDGIRVGVETP